MGTGEEPPARRENGGRRRRWTDDDDEEYVAEEEEDFAEELSASSAGEEGEDSDAEYQDDEEEETPRPKGPVKGGARGRKGKMDPATARAKRRRYEVDDDYEDEPSDDEEVEEYDEETRRPKRPVKGDACGRKGKMDPASGRARQRRYEVDDDYDYEDEPCDDDGVEEYDEETPRLKRPVKGGACGRKGKMDPATGQARQRRYEVDDDYEDDPSDDEGVEEYDEETPRPKRPVKGVTCRRKGKMDPATRRARQRRYEVDYDYEDEPSNDEGVEEYDEETPRPKRPVKGGACGQKGKMDPATGRARQRRYEVDDDYKEEPDEGEEEPNEDEEVEEYHEEIEEEEEAPSQPRSVAECAGSGQNVELPRSHRRKYEEDDMDFEPELDDEEEEVDEDIDFYPEVDDEDEDEFDDEEEDEFGAVRARKVTVKNPAKRKSISKRRSLEKKKANKGSKASKRKIGSAKAKKSALVRRVRKRFVVDDSDADSEDDDDFIVDDQVEVNRHPRKKARTGSSKQTELEHPSVVDEETWPNVESETSEFEFVTSDDEPDDAGTAVVEASTVRKGRRKRKSGSESSSDSEFIVSDKELENLVETGPPKVQPVLPTPICKNSITRHVEDKGKKKEEPEEAGKSICGICLSEEQRATVQGVLNCCSHYFCFACIMEWSRVESRCPLCKQRFTTITKSSKADLGLGLRKAIIKVEERDQVYQPTEEEIRRWLDPYENVVCIECNQGGDDSLMLLCDICDSSAHTYCVGLGREVPEGNWYCGGCRLNDEGPSHVRTPHTVGYERQSYRNHVDFSSVGFGMAAQNGTYDRSSLLNRRRSFQGIDLNLSPGEVPGEIHPAESQVSTDSVSTPGRRATVSGRRQIHRYIRILLSRPRPITTTRIEDICPNFVQLNGAVPRTEPNHRSFCSSSEANTSQILPDGIQNQHNGLPFAPSMPLDGDDFQHIEGVKSNLKNVQ